MKILDLQFKKLDETIIRSMKFHESGLSVIYGKVVNRNNVKESTNGVGKSIVMKSINYLFGANNDASLYLKLADFKIRATILLESQTHVVERELKKDGVILFDGMPLALEEYKNKLGVDRNLVRKMILLDARNKVAETPGTAYNPNDLIALFKLLGLNRISSLVADLDAKKKEHKTTQESIKQLVELMGLSEINLENRLLENQEKLNTIKEKEAELLNRIKSLSVNEENASLQSAFEEDNRKIKELRKENYGLESESRQLKSYLSDSVSFSLSSNDIKAIYEESKIVLPDHVYETLDQVELFYEKVIEDRREAIEKRVAAIRSSMAKNNEAIGELTKAMAEKSEILSKNDAYQNSVFLLNEAQKTIEELYIEKGRLDHYSQFTKKRHGIEQTMMRLYEELGKEKELCSSRIDEYKKFILDVSKTVYDDDEATLSIDFKTYSLKSLPASFDISLRKEHSSGVSQVKNLMFDYLLFKYCMDSELLAHDSSCFNEIDTRQISSLLKVGSEIAREKAKQYIVAINGYDVHESAEELILDSIVLELSENDNLLGLNF